MTLHGFSASPWQSQESHWGLLDSMLNNCSIYVQNHYTYTKPIRTTVSSSIKRYKNIQQGEMRQQICPAVSSIYKCVVCGQELFTPPNMADMCCRTRRNHFGTAPSEKCHMFLVVTSMSFRIRQTWVGIPALKLIGYEHESLWGLDETICANYTCSMVLNT